MVIVQLILVVVRLCLFLTPFFSIKTVPFGKLALGSMWKAAGTLILEQGAEKLGVLEWVSENIMG